MKTRVNLEPFSTRRKSERVAFMTCSFPPVVEALLRQASSAVSFAVYLALSMLQWDWKASMAFAS